MELCSSMSDETKSGPEVREGSRIAKVMARAGLCSRRDAEAWIAAGRVTVNGKVLESPAYNVSDADDVRVDGQRLAAPRAHAALPVPQAARARHHRARSRRGGRRSSTRCRRTCRASSRSAGSTSTPRACMLLTNDGGLARVLELPATGWLRRYRVRAHGRVDQAQLDSLERRRSPSTAIDYAGIEARLDREQGSNAWITMGLREGKNREIKKVLEHLGLAVNRLIRISFGPFELGDLAEGEVAEVRTRVLRDQLGAKLAQRGGRRFRRADRRARAAASRPREAARRAARRESVSARAARRPPGAARRGAPGGPRARGRAAREPARRRRRPSAGASTSRRCGRRSPPTAAGPRKRIERSATQDRKGRTVAVERDLAAGEERAGAPAESRPRRRRTERRARPGERRRPAVRPGSATAAGAAAAKPGARRMSAGAASRDEPRSAVDGRGERPDRARRAEGDRAQRRDGAPRAGRDARGRGERRRDRFKPRGSAEDAGGAAPRRRAARARSTPERAAAEALRGRPRGASARPEAARSASPRARAEARRRRPRRRAARARQGERRQAFGGAAPCGRGGRPATAARRRARGRARAGRRAAPTAAKALSDADRRRPAQGPRPRRAGFARHPPDLGAPARVDLRHPRASLSRPRRGPAGGRPLRRLRGAGDRGAVARGALRALRRQRSRSARAAARQCRGAGARRRHPHLAGRCDAARRGARPAVRSRSPFSTRPMARISPARRSPRSSQGGWLEPDALCVVEEAAKAEIAAPAGLALVDERDLWRYADRRSSSARRPASYSRIGIDVGSDEARFALPVALQLLLQLGVGQSRRQVLRVEIGRDDLKQIMVRRTRRRTGAAETGELLAARAADIFVARLARSRLPRTRSPRARSRRRPNGRCPRRYPRPGRRRRRRSCCVPSGGFDQESCGRNILALAVRPARRDVAGLPRQAARRP